jgi:hypothetical protein
MISKFSGTQEVSGYSHSRVAELPSTTSLQSGETRSGGNKDPGSQIVSQALRNRPESANTRIAMKAFRDILFSLARVNIQFLGNRKTIKIERTFKRNMVPASILIYAVADNKLLLIFLME